MQDRGLLDGSFAWFWNRMDASTGGQKVLADGIAATGATFETLGVRPHIGRLLAPADDQTNDSVAVISYRFWQRRFNSSPDVLGQSITIERRPHTIVGVTPPAFEGVYVGLPFDVAVPLRISRTKPSGPFVIVMARLKRGQSAEAVTATLRAAQPHIRDATNPYAMSPYREDYLREPFTVRSASGGVSALRRRYETPLKALLVIVALVLLVACGTIATLLVARTTARLRELSVRAALGASRSRLVRQLMTESLILALVGTLLGVLVAQSSTRLILTHLSTEAFTVHLDVTPDWRVIAFTTALGALTAVLFGTAAAVRATRANALELLRTRGPFVEGGFVLGGGALVLQIAFSLILVVMTGLFVRTFLALHGTNVGFDRERVLVATIDAMHGIAAGERSALYQRLAPLVREIPDVESAGVSLDMPGGNSASTPWVELLDETTLPHGMTGVYAHRVSDDWFVALGTRVVEGRDFSDRDRADAAGVVIVNQTFARRFLDGQRAVGQTIFERTDAPDGPRHALEIVGVVEDAMYVRLKEPPPPTIYTPFAQFATERSQVHLSVRAKGRLSPAISASVTSAVSRVDPRLSLTFRTLRDQIESQYTQERLVAGISVFFGTLALLLAALGLYALASYSVTRRKFEIGVRMALGASTVGVVRAVLGRVASFVALGIIAGSMTSLWAVRLARSLLYGVDAQDWSVLAGPAALLVVAALLAAAPPVRRAIRTDPASVLREG